MLVNQAYRYELDPTRAQRVLLAKHAGAKRKAWNWALAKRQELYERTKKSTNAIEQHKELNKLKKTEFPWMYEVSKCAPQEALRDLDRAYRNFYRRFKEGLGDPGFPKFKKKFQHDSFRLTGSIHVQERSVVLPRLGKLRLKERAIKYLNAEIKKLMSATVSREADRWYVSLAVEVERPDPDPAQGPIVGVDLGLTNFAAISTPDGKEVELVKAPKPLKKATRLLARRQRQHARKKKGSKNRRKSAQRLARLNRKIKNQRLDFTHKFTTRLAKTKSVIVLEDLAVKNMLSNHKLAKAISDVAWGEVRRQLEYKTQWYGSKLVIYPRFEPSTGPCSDCGARNAWVKLGDQEFVCEGCGKLLERDPNAAKNLALFGERTTGSSPGSVVRKNDDACGETTAGPDVTTVERRTKGRRPRRSRKKATNSSRRKAG